MSDGWNGKACRVILRTTEAVGAIGSCPAPLYNSLAVGGVLIRFVQEQPVFIDNRNDPYPVHLLEASLRLEQSGDYEGLFAQYGIRCAVVETESFTDARLRADERWLSVYRDAQFAVYRSKSDP